MPPDPPPPGNPPPMPGQRNPQGLNPNANPVDPNAITVADLNQDRFVAPFGNSGHIVELYSAPWWFEYFWQEARSQANRESTIPGKTVKQALAEVANSIFIKERVGTTRDFTLKLRPEVSSWDGANATWKNALIILLRLGFRAVQTKAIAPQQGIPMINTPNNSDLLLLQQRMFGLKVRKMEKNGIDINTIPVFWRSELRDVSRIVQQGGTKRQCDVGVIATSMKMDASWHPFSDPEISTYMWFRLGNTDNDYFTVISVATDFATACGFPKIDERRVYKFPQSQVSTWSKGQAARFRDNLCVVIENGQRTVRLITTTVAYMLIHNGSVLDTAGVNSSNGVATFPEIGVDNIPLENIYATFPVRRVHHGPGIGDGFTVFVDSTNCKRMHTSTEEQYYGLKLSRRLFDIYMDRAYRQPAFATAWGSGGAQAPGIVTNISQLVEFPISDTSFNNFKATLADGELPVGQRPANSPQNNLKAVLGQLPKKS